MQSAEKEATHALGPCPISVYLFVPLVGCRLLQNALGLGRLYLGSEIVISKRRPLNSAVSTPLDPGVQPLPSIPPSSRCLFSCSCLQYLLLYSVTRSYIHGPIHNYPWFQVVLALPSISCSKPTSLNLMVPKLLRKGLLFCFFHTKAVEVH